MFLRLYKNELHLISPGTQWTIISEEKNTQTMKVSNAQTINSEFSSEQVLAKEPDGELIQITFSNTNQKEECNSGISYYTYTL